MDNKQDTFSLQDALRSTRASNDVLILILITVAVLVLSYFFDIFAFLVHFVRRHPRAISFIDEIVTGLLTLSVGFGAISWRRWMEFKKEAAERIRVQEELIKIAETKADTERIISKQLHEEIEERKRLEKEMLRFPARPKEEEAE